VQKLGVHVVEQTRKVLAHRRKKVAQRPRQEHACGFSAVRAGRQRCRAGLAVLTVLDRTQAETDQETSGSSCLFVVAPQRAHGELG